MNALKQAAYSWGKRTAEQAYCAEVPLRGKENVSQPFTPMNTNGATAGGY